MMDDVHKIQPGFRVTAEWLRKEGACKQQITRFENVYPEGMLVTTRNLNIARSKHRLNTRWLIKTILTWHEKAVVLREYSGANPQIYKWPAKNARLFHSAFIKILGER